VPNQKADLAKEQKAIAKGTCTMQQRSDTEQLPEHATEGIWDKKYTSNMCEGGQDEEKAVAEGNTSRQPEFKTMRLRS
jgi:hypothetical protein